MRKLSKFARYAWVVLAYNILVVLWGAFVRATGSGAGCGSHWPLCNGQVVPRSPQVETIIEFSHRLSSGMALLLIIVLFVAAWRTHPKKYPVRIAAALSFFFVITEALVGAALVLFEWVAQDISTGRVISISVHLVNTFLLLASLTLTAWFSSGGQALRIIGRERLALKYGVCLAGIILIGVTGAVTALGDTLFPSSSLAEGLRQDFSGTSHYLLRLRIWHPVVAVLVAIYSGFIALRELRLNTDRSSRRIAMVFGSFLVLQLGAGLLNVLLLAPVWMQLVHLLLADLVWISMIGLVASVFRNPDQTV